MNQNRAEPLECEWPNVKAITAYGYGCRCKRCRLAKATEKARLKTGVYKRRWPNGAMPIEEQRERARQQKKIKRVGRTTCRQEGCSNVPARAQQYCPEHQAERRNASSKRGGARTRWRARITATLRERDGDECGHCGGPMVFIPWPGPDGDDDRATIDHVTPRSKGGSDEMSNLRLTHWVCNKAKRDD